MRFASSEGTTKSKCLTENEKFVKKLDIQIDIIKKIIDPGEILPLLKMNGKSELK